VPHPFLTHERPGAVRAIAHRGGGGTRENTLAAFAAAVELGYRHLETDVHVTRDGELVVSHDPTLARVAGDPRPIAQLTAAEVRAVRVAGSEPVPTFLELVDAFPDALLTVDLKVDGAVAPMLRLLEQRPELLERGCFGAFSGRRVGALRRSFGARICTAATPGETFRLLSAVRMRRRPPTIAADLVAVPEHYPEPRGRRALRVADPTFIGAVAEQGLAVHVWTVNDPERMTALVAAGAEGLVSDELPVLREVLSGLGRW
jgi:glycerophosphoryl diester phosphodiesterase